MTNWIAAAVAGALMTASATVAEAKTKSFIINGESFLQPLQPGGGLPDPGGVEMEDALEEYFRFGFTLPGNYKKNSPIKIVFKTLSSATPCTAVISVTNVFRLRAGAEWHNEAGSTSGMAGRTITYPATAYKVINAAFTLRRATAGKITDQKAGDQIIISMKRLGNDPADVCADSIEFNSAKVIYTVN